MACPAAQQLCTWRLLSGSSFTCSLLPCNPDGVPECNRRPRLRRVLRQHLHGLLPRMAKGSRCRWPGKAGRTVAAQMARSGWENDVQPRLAAGNAPCMVKVSPDASEVVPILPSLRCSATQACSLLEAPNQAAWMRQKEPIEQHLATSQGKNNDGPHRMCMPAVFTRLQGTLAWGGRRGCNLQMRNERQTRNMSLRQRDEGCRQRACTHEGERGQGERGREKVAAM